MAKLTEQMESYFAAASVSQKNVSVEFLEILAAYESRFDPTAYNKSGATGLFEFIQGTARAYGLKDRFDPSYFLET